MFYRDPAGILCMFNVPVRICLPLIMNPRSRNGLGLSGKARLKEVASESLDAGASPLALPQADSAMFYAYSSSAAPALHPGYLRFSATGPPRGGYAHKYAHRGTVSRAAAHRGPSQARSVCMLCGVMSISCIFLHSVGIGEKSSPLSARPMTDPSERGCSPA